MKIIALILLSALALSISACSTTAKKECASSSGSCCAEVQHKH